MQHLCFYDEFTKLNILTSPKHVQIQSDYKINNILFDSLKSTHMEAHTYHNFNQQIMRAAVQVYQTTDSIKLNYKES